MSIKSDYMKERRKVQRRIRDIEKRGYTVDKRILPPIPKRPTQASINRLKAITPEKIYKKSTYTTSEGQVIKGTERRKQEKRESARKAARTRKERKKREVYEVTDFPPGEEADIIITRLFDMIKGYDDYHENTAQILRNEINAQIENMGKDRFAQYIAQQDELPPLIEKALNYKVGTPQHSAALIDAIVIIRGGEVLTPEEMQNFSDVFDQDEMIDVDEWFDYALDDDGLPFD